MKTKKIGLLVWVLAGIALGGVLGAILPAWGIRALNTFRGMFLDFVKFLVPLIIIGFMIPAIADAGKGAGRMLFLTLGFAYVLTIISGCFSFAIARLALPHFMSGGVEIMTAKADFPAYFGMSLSPILGIGASIVLAILFGIGITVRGADAVLSIVKQFRDIVSWILSRVVMPMLPLYVLAVSADMSASGRLMQMAHSFTALMLLCISMTIAITVLQYAVAGLVSGRDPFRALINMLPAYFTGLGCCSSAATMPVTIKQTIKNGVSVSTANLTVPICANVHLSGAICNMVAYAIGVMVLAGQPISFASFIQFILQASIVAVAGIPGGMVLASSSIAESVLGISAGNYAMIVAMYLILDGVGTACNVAGSGAIAMVVDRFRDRDFMPKIAATPKVLPRPFELAHAA